MTNGNAASAHGGPGRHGNPPQSPEAAISPATVSTSPPAGSIEDPVGSRLNLIQKGFDALLEGSESMNSFADSLKDAKGRYVLALEGGEI